MKPLGAFHPRLVPTPKDLALMKLVQSQAQPLAPLGACVVRTLRSSQLLAADMADLMAARIHQLTPGEIVLLGKELPDSLEKLLSTQWDKLTLQQLASVVQARSARQSSSQREAMYRNLLLPTLLASEASEAGARRPAAVAPLHKLPFHKLVANPRAALTVEGLGLPTRLRWFAIGVGFAGLSKEQPREWFYIARNAMLADWRFAPQLRSASRLTQEIGKLYDDWARSALDAGPSKDHRLFIQLERDWLRSNNRRDTRPLIQAARASLDRFEAALESLPQR